MKPSLKRLLDQVAAQLHRGEQRLESCRETLGDETFDSAMRRAFDDIVDDGEDYGEAGEKGYVPTWAEPEESK